MKIYIDDVSWRDLWDILIALPKQLFLLVEEEWFWWTKLYHFEMSYPVDWEKLCKKGLAESKSRIKHYHNAQNQYLRGSGAK